MELDIDKEILREYRNEQLKMYRRFHHTLAEVLRHYIEETGNAPSSTTLKEFIEWTYMKSLSIAIGKPMEKK